MSDRTSKKLRFGIVGCGMIASIHAEEIRGEDVLEVDARESRETIRIIKDIYRAAGGV